MPTVKGKIEKYGFNGDNNWWIKVGGFENIIGGFGKMPDNIKTAIDSQSEIDIEYHIKKGDTKDFYNYGPEPKRKGGNGKATEELLKILVMPKLSVAVEKTIQEKQFEPKKISVHISQHVESADPERIRAMIELIEAEVVGKTLEWKESREQAGFRTPKPPTTEESEINREMGKATEKSDSDPNQEVFSQASEIKGEDDG